MTVFGILRTVLRHVPDALVPGTRPEPATRGPARPCRRAGVAARRRAEGARRGAVRRRGRDGGAAPRRRRAFDDRARPDRPLDTAAAEAAPGVALVMTHRNAPRMKPPQVFGEGNGVAGSNLPILQDDSVHWNGEAVAVVLAETQEQADHAAGLVSVTYEPEPAVTDFAAAQEEGARSGRRCSASPRSSRSAMPRRRWPPPPHRVDATYTTPFLNHNAIELHAATVRWDGDKLVVHDATQMISGTAGALARVFGLKAEQVRVLSPFVGGGFGGKGLWSHQILAAAASKLAGRPVRLVPSREGVYRLVGGRTTTVQRVALGAASDGKLDALIHTGVVAMTAHNNCPEQFTFPARHLYAAEKLPAGAEGGRHGHAGQHLHARARRIGRHLRAGERDRRAGARHEDRPDRAPAALGARARSDVAARPFVAPPGEGLRRRRGALRLGQARGDARPAGATANGFSAWAWRPRPIPTTACRASRRGCGSMRTAGSRCRRRATRWAWARPRCRRSTPPTGWA